MSHDEHPNPNKQDDPVTEPLAFAAFVGAVLVVASVVGLQAMYYREETTMARRSYYDVPQRDVLTLLANQDAEISHYRWVDRDHRVVGIPIERAMKSVAQELAQEAASGKSPASRP